MGKTGEVFWVSAALCNSKAVPQPKQHKALLLWFWPERWRDGDRDEAGTAALSKHYWAGRRHESQETRSISKWQAPGRVVVRERGEICFHRRIKIVTYKAAHPRQTPLKWQWGSSYSRRKQFVPHDLSTVMASDHLAGKPDGIHLPKLSLEFSSTFCYWSWYTISSLVPQIALSVMKNRDLMSYGSKVH